MGPPSRACENNRELGLKSIPVLRWKKNKKNNTVAQEEIKLYSSIIIIVTLIKISPCTSEKLMQPDCGPVLLLGVWLDAVSKSISFLGLR